MRAFDIIPVLDLQHGIVVRGVAGQRDRYQPNHSLWTSSTDPLETAVAIRDQFGLSRLYIADLDAILGRGTHLDDLRRLHTHGFSLLLDAGIQQVEQARTYMDLGIEQIIVGLETLPDWSTLELLLQLLTPSRLTFSLDLKSGTPLGPLGHRQQPLDVITQARNCGVRRFIVLDLASVGTGCGVPTLPLCRTIRERDPDAHLITGGGIRNATDVEDVRRAELDGVLVSSALHDGQLMLTDNPSPSQ